MNMVIHCRLRFVIHLYAKDIYDLGSFNIKASHSESGSAFSEWEEVL